MTVRLTWLQLWKIMSTLTARSTCMHDASLIKVMTIYLHLLTTNMQCHLKRIFVLLWKSFYLQGQSTYLTNNFYYYCVQHFTTCIDMNMQITGMLIIMFIYIYHLQIYTRICCVLTQFDGVVDQEPMCKVVYSCII